MGDELTLFDVVVLLAVVALVCALAVGAADRIMAGRGEERLEDEQVSKDWRWPPR